MISLMGMLFSGVLRRLDCDSDFDWCSFIDYVKGFEVRDEEFTDIWSIGQYFVPSPPADTIQEQVEPVDFQDLLQRFLPLTLRCFIWSMSLISSG